MDIQHSLSIHGSYLKGEKVIITSGSQQRVAFSMLIVGIVFLGLLTFFNAKFWKEGNVMAVYLVNVFSISLIFLFLLSSLRLVDLGLKKDAVFISHFFSSSRIIGLEDIRTMRDFNFFGYHIVCVYYSFDNRNRKGIFFKNCKRESRKKLELLFAQFEKMKEEKSANL